MKYIKYLFVFILGAAAYQLFIVWLFNPYNYSTKSNYSGLSDSYVSSKLKDVCNHLNERGCSCRPVIHTENRCVGKLREFLARKSKNLNP